MNVTEEIIKYPESTILHIKSKSDIVLLKCHSSVDEEDLGEHISKFKNGKIIKIPSIIKLNGGLYLIIIFKDKITILKKYNKCLDAKGKSKNSTRITLDGPLKFNIDAKKENLTSIRKRLSNGDSFILHRKKNNDIVYGVPSLINSFNDQIIYYFNLSIPTKNTITPYEIFQVINDPIDFDISNNNIFCNSNINQKTFHKSTLILSKTDKIYLKKLHRNDIKEFFGKYDIALNYCFITGKDFTILNNNSHDLSIFNDTFIKNNNILFNFKIKSKTSNEVNHKLVDKYFFQFKCNSKKFQNIEEINEATSVMWCTKYSNDMVNREIIQTKVNFQLINNYLIFEGKYIPTKILHCQCQSSSKKRKNDLTFDSYNISNKLINKISKNKTNTTSVNDKIDTNKNSRNLTIVQGILFIILIASIFVSTAFSIRWCLMKFVSKNDKQDNEKNTILRDKIRYPNIEEWWNGVISNDFIVTCQNVYDYEYQGMITENTDIPNKVKGMKQKTMDKEKKSNLKSLSKNCTKNVDIKNLFIIKNITHKRSYILIKFPSSGKERETFVEYLFKSNTTNIIATISEDKYSFFQKFYCPSKLKKYGNIFLEFLEVNQLQNIDILFIKLKLTHFSGSKKRIWVYFIPDVSGNEKLLNKECDNTYDNNLNYLNIIPYIYEHILKSSGSRNILIHSEGEINKSVLILAYFCTIVDGMTTDFSLTNPLKIVKKIRSIYNECNFGSLDYGYLIIILSRYFCSGNYVSNVDYEKNLNKYYIGYRNFVDDKRNKEFYEMLSFEIVQDMLDKLWNNYEIDDRKELELKCQTWFEICKLTIGREIIRCNKFSCYEDDCLIFPTSKDKTLLTAFLNGNYMEYEFLEKKKRRLIMCQAPTQYTCINMLGYLYNEMPTIIVILSGGNEKLNDIAPYLFKQDNKNDPLLGEYTSEIDKNQSTDSLPNCDTFKINVKKSGEGKMVQIKVFHYKEWPQKGIPSNYKDIVQLLNTINNYEKSESIVIHGKTGIGRTGSLATIIYMIDMMAVNNEFNPISHLNDIRECRYGAVETKQQFLFIIMVYCEIFRNSIEQVNPGATNRYTSLLHNLIRINFKTFFHKKM